MLHHSTARSRSKGCQGDRGWQGELCATETELARVARLREDQPWRLGLLATRCPADCRSAARACAASATAHVATREQTAVCSEVEVVDQE